MYYMENIQSLVLQMQNNTTGYHNVDSFKHMALKQHSYKYVLSFFLILFGYLSLLLATLSQCSVMEKVFIDHIKD